jgi:hypothetical protein
MMWTRANSDTSKAQFCNILFGCLPFASKLSSDTRTPGTARPNKLQLVYPGNAMAGNLVGFVAQPMTASLHLLCWPALSHKNKNMKTQKYKKTIKSTYITDSILIRIQFLFLRQDTAIKNEKKYEKC